MLIDVIDRNAPGYANMVIQDTGRRQTHTTQKAKKDEVHGPHQV